MNQKASRCEGDARTFHADEASAAGQSRCASLGYTDPGDMAIDLEGKTYRTDVAPPSHEQQVQKALDDGHTLLFHKPSK